MNGSSLPRMPRINKILIGIISSAVIALIMAPEIYAEPPANTEFKYQIGQHYPLVLSQTSAIATEQLPHSALVWKTHTIKNGESLAVAFDSVGLGSGLLHKIITTSNKTKKLTSLRPGDNLNFGFDDTGKLMELHQPLTNLETLVVKRNSNNNDFTAAITKQQIETQTNYAQATIDSSFWSAADKAGLTANQIMEIAALFGWDIDFALDIRTGDKFEVLFEQHYLDGNPIDHGNILAATFTNMGQTFTAVRHQNGKYYDKDGQAMRKAFLRSPINFRYVSSNFNPRRLHPVTKQVKAHRGTDYVAPVGTPIWAAGDGVVTESSYNQFNGNYVFIRHNGNYVTKYLHMTKRMVKSGQRIKQGQTIGTLGGTGRVTGPHLHYEFLVNGQHQNPRTVDLPQAYSLSGSTQTAFKQQAGNKLGLVKNYSHLLAKNGILLPQS
ncbi:peptidoglycan DD-metalloendopeptidase family protein [Photobacterium sp. S4TG1]|uniref:peptidoglycan DD-metalloendopeptidase family protein n=1 Tax=Photobacterium sp. S4TG1 TaxID=3114587 RepID=UPI002E17F43A|nr:peptidoglycan DD-metalloendopeptidase family protein [Photobacterium sp. S4TG1]